MIEIKNLFTSHPNDKGMSYWDHFKHSSIITIQLLIATICLIIHAIFPFLFKKTTSKLVNKIKKSIDI